MLNFLVVWVKLLHFHLQCAISPICIQILVCRILLPVLWYVPMLGIATLGQLLHTASDRLTLGSFRLPLLNESLIADWLIYTTGWWRPSLFWDLLTMSDFLGVPSPSMLLTKLPYTISGDFRVISTFWFPIFAASTLKSAESSSTLVTSRLWRSKLTKTSTASKCSSPILQRWLLSPPGHRHGVLAIGDGVCQRKVQHCPSDGESWINNFLPCIVIYRWAASPPTVKPSMARFLPSIWR